MVVNCFLNMLPAVCNEYFLSFLCTQVANSCVLAWKHSDLLSAYYVSNYRGGCQAYEDKRPSKCWENCNTHGGGEKDS